MKNYPSHLRALALLVVSSFVISCTDAPPPAPPAPKIEYHTISLKPLNPAVEFVGRTVASEDVSIKARVSGQLLARHFNDGAQVEQNQLLFEIDPASYTAELNRQKAALSQAKSAYEVASLQYSRGKQLNEKKLLSDMDMDELTSRMLQAKASVEGAESAVEVAELNLEYTKVYAPVAGRMSKSEVFIGDLITPERQMASLVQVDPMWIDFQVSERSVLNARQKLRENGADSLDQLDISLRLPNNTVFDQKGRINASENRIDQATGTISIRAIFPNPDQILIPGMYVTLIIEGVKPVQAVLIEQRAISQDQQGHFVMVVKDDNTVEKRIIKVGNQQGIYWHVEEGLSAGERVVINGLQRIRPGITVDPVEVSAVPFESN
ncbi:efflux RND transporter periplasmic adaptor subunit [Neiella sp. HB171785]|uniref:Efflux RND transporter periplasmic adaptor subunit n=1 Tax=Neiella litorisoli TaxID=2771431 RepID=A0A8J6QLB5_9GAMM|nr:efflux RND transporter periplasmic adaptor subunit [Neiella litorisoli]MBD1390446.1 efflux RND transporter periplasmic adaptor subunit [Neiella litorisoli]